MKEKIFVYGTLLEGQGNHRAFLSNARKFGEYTTEPEFTMLHLGGFPGVVPEGETAVIGEVYEVTEEEFRHVDSLEGYNERNPKSGLYNRMQISTPFGLAWMYTINDRYSNDSQTNIIKSGSWLTQ